MDNLGPLENVLSGLDNRGNGDGGGGFTSGIAQAALANPDGPLAIVGHIDLAWSYSYEELEVESSGGGHGIKGSNRSQNFTDLLSLLLSDRQRVGVSMLKMQHQLMDVGTELNRRYNACKERGVEPEGASAEERLALGNLWMLRQDLQGYVLLGDPAARLPLATDAGPSAAERRQRMLSGMMGGRSSSAGARSSAASAGGRLETIEKAVLQVANGEDVDDVASEAGFGSRELKRWRDIYCRAGQRALADALSPNDDDDD